MRTPLVDFARSYVSRQTVRLHMPGHKGRQGIGPEPLDLTEIDGADELYHSHGIIRESEDNAAALFGASRTCYSTEGSSLCIRAMLYLALLRAKKENLPVRILAGRNAHRTLMTAAALLDAEVDWLWPSGREDRLSCCPEPEEIREKLAKKAYMAVYLTSPDYLGNRADIRGIAEVCHCFHTPLLVDNAHGAYLKFLPADTHPLTLGADLCCDSAHKTLRCLTGAAYLHLGQNAPALWREQAENALAMFGSTSPSYLILQSLDQMNAELAGTYPALLANAAEQLEALKRDLSGRGWLLQGDEPLKLTLQTKKMGYTGTELAGYLRKQGIESEFADPDNLTLMPSADTTAADWERLRDTLRSVPFREPIREEPPALPRLPGVMGIREAMLAPRRRIRVEQAAGEVLAEAEVGCPPAVPIVCAGERMNEAAVQCFRYYGMEHLSVVCGPEWD